MLEEKWTELAERFYLGCERERESRKVFGLSCDEDGLTVNKVE